MFCMQFEGLRARCHGYVEKFPRGVSRVALGFPCDMSLFCGGLQVYLRRIWDIIAGGRSRGAGLLICDG